jgi:hypothetical protein
LGPEVVQNSYRHFKGGQGGELSSIKQFLSSSDLLKGNVAVSDGIPQNLLLRKLFLDSLLEYLSRRHKFQLVLIGKDNRIQGLAAFRLFRTSVKQHLSIVLLHLIITKLY